MTESIISFTIFIIHKCLLLISLHITGLIKRKVYFSTWSSLYISEPVASSAANIGTSSGIQWAILFSTLLALNCMEWTLENHYLFESSGFPRMKLLCVILILVFLYLIQVSSLFLCGNIIILYFGTNLVPQNYCCYVNHNFIKS